MDPESLQINRIAFVNAHGQLCTIAPNGSALRVLSDDSRFFQFPAWSPDSNMIAAIASDRRSSGIVLAQDTAGSARPIYHGEEGPPIYLYWCPNSSAVSFIAAEGSDFGLHVASTGGERRVRAHGQPFFWSFQPDGSALLAHTNGSGEPGKLRLLTTSSADEGFELATPGLFQAPDIAPNGDYLAYAAFDPTHGARLMVTDHAGVPAASIDYHGVVALAWSPCESQLAFIHPFEQSAHWYGPLQLLDMASGEVRLLVDDEIIAFFWAPDGSAIAYLTLAPSRHASREPSVRNDENGTPPSAPQPTNLTLSLGVVEIADGQVRRLARFEPQSLFINQFLPFFDQYSRSHRIWSPDSRAIVLPLMAHATSHIAVVPRDGSRAHVIVEGAMPFWSTM